MSVLIFVYLLIAAISYTYMDTGQGDHDLKTISKTVMSALSWPIAAVVLYLGHVKKRGSND